METQDFKTSAAKAFREHYDKLVKSIQEPDLPALGAYFFSRQIISTETMEMVGNVSTSRAVRVSKLMLAVMAHLDVHPDKFESALDVFREELVYAEIATLIASSYSSMGKCIVYLDKLYSIKGVYREEGMQLTLFSESPNLVLIYFWTAHTKTPTRNLWPHKVNQSL